MERVYSGSEKAQNGRNRGIRVSAGDGPTDVLPAGNRPGPPVKLLAGIRRSEEVRPDETLDQLPKLASFVQTIGF
jgi:hypothetical protein